MAITTPIRNYAINEARKYLAPVAYFSFLAGYIYAEYNKKRGGRK
jgi:hypothetical protein